MPHRSSHQIAGQALDSLVVDDAELEPSIVPSWSVGLLARRGSSGGPIWTWNPLWRRE